jgi:hypothetical protein
MKPGDLVTLGRGTSARLYGTQRLDDGNRDNKPDIVHVVFGREVGLVLASVENVHLLLFGDKFGWRDALPWKVIACARG